jgi:hypothetical protein
MEMAKNELLLGYVSQSWSMFARVHAELRYIDPNFRTHNRPNVEFTWEPHMAEREAIFDGADR